LPNFKQNLLQSMPPFTVDPAVAAFRRAAAQKWSDVSGKAAINTAIEIFAENPPPHAAEYLARVIAAMHEHIQRAHSGYGGVRWLWYLRRAPNDFFSGSYGTTIGYDRFLAEVVSSTFPKEDKSELVTRIAFRVDDAAARHFASFVGRVKLLSHLHILYRRVGKGATLDARKPILVARTPVAVENAIAIYDEGTTARMNSGSGLGLATVEPSYPDFVESAENLGLSAFLSFGLRAELLPLYPIPGR
jgi:hypothetical protein